MFLDFPCGSTGRESGCNAGNLGLIPGLGRSPGEGKGYPLQYSGLENSMDCIVHGIAKSRSRLSDFHFTMELQSVQFSRSVMSDSLRHHESQHARPPCPSPTPRVHPDPRPLSQWCHPAISSSVVPFSSCPLSLPASESSNESTLRTRWPKDWSFSLSIIPSKEIPGLISFRMDWLDLLAVLVWWNKAI